MSADDLVDELKDLGCHLVLEAGQPKIIPPRDASTEVLAQLASLVPDLKQHRDDLIESLHRRCPLCERDVSDAEDRERLKDPLYCEHFGSCAVTDGTGVTHPETQRCPFKERR